MGKQKLFVKILVMAIGHIQLSKTGVATALISIPNRYMHIPVEMCDTTDVFNTIQLLFNSIKKMQNLKKSSLYPW